jgi:hypothetical protein
MVRLSSGLSGVGSTIRIRAGSGVTVQMVSSALLSVIEADK